MNTSEYLDLVTDFDTGVVGPAGPPPLRGHVPSRLST